MPRPSATTNQGGILRAFSAPWWTYRISPAAEWNPSPRFSPAIANPIRHAVLKTSAAGAHRANSGHTLLGAFRIRSPGRGSGYGDGQHGLHREQADYELRAGSGDPIQQLGRGQREGPGQEHLPRRRCRRDRPEPLPHGDEGPDGRDRHGEAAGRRGAHGERVEHRDFPHEGRAGLRRDRRRGVVMDDILAAAATVDWARLGERRVCDACLGRLVGKAGHGFANPERGRAVRDVRRLPTPSDPCWVCEGLLGEILKFADLAAAALAAWDFQTFLVGSKVDAEGAAREESLWAELSLAQAEPLKAGVNREVGKLLAASTGKVPEFHRPDVTAVVDTQFDVVEVDVAPLFVYGRYRKLSRDIPQTRWPCRRCQGKGCAHCGGKGKMYDTSVEEIVAAQLMAQTGGGRPALPRGGGGEGGARHLRDAGPGAPRVFAARR